MKKIIVFILFLIPNISFSQSSWEWVNPKPDNFSVFNKSFPDGMTGYVLGLSDVIRKTTDGGNNWSTVYGGNSSLLRRISAPDANTVYAAGNNNTFLKTTDGGSSWNDVIVDTIQMGFITMAFLNSNTGYVYGFIYDNGYNNLYKTTDAGLSWVNIYTTTTSVNHLQFLDENTGYAFYPSRTYKTTNGGQNWMYYNYPYYSPNTVLFINAETGYASMSGGLTKTTNGGLNFFQLNIGTSQDDTTVYDISFINESTGFTISKYKIFRTRDSGKSWDAFDVAPFNEFENGRSAKIYFNSAEQGFIFNIRGVIFNSTNSGETWNRFTTGFSHDVWIMDIIDSTGLYLITTEKDENSSEYYYFVRSWDQGNNWVIYNLDYLEDEFYTKMKFLNSNVGFLKSYRRLYRTMGGSSWSSNFFNSEFITDFDFIDINTGYLIDDYSRLYKTVNTGNSWNLLVTIQNSLFPYKIDFINANTGFLCDNYGISKTTNGGTNWFPIYFSLDRMNREEDHNIYFLDLNNICIFGGSQLIKSTSGGSNWHTLPLPCTVYESAVINNTYYIWGSIGYPNFRYFKSIDGGITWNQFVTGIDRDIYGIKFINENTGYIYADYGTILRTTNGGTTFINNISSSVPAEYILYQNYPNPFNPSTKIKFEIPKAGNVELVIYDITGRETAKLINESLNAGSYEVIFNAAGISSGIYFYTLRGENFLQSKKMIYIK